MIPRTIGGRLTAAAAATVLAGVAVVILVAPLVARQHETDVVGDRLASDARLVADLAQEGFRNRDSDALDALAKRVARDEALRVTLIAPDGVVLGESDEDRHLMENHADRPEVRAAVTGGEGRSVRHSATVNRDLLYVAVAVRDGQAIVGVARSALPLSAIDSLASRLAGLILSTVLVAAAAGLIVSVVLARAIARPILEFEHRPSYVAPLGGHNLERTSDRVQNICERTVYEVTGIMREFSQAARGRDEAS